MPNGSRTSGALSDLRHLYVQSALMRKQREQQLRDMEQRRQWQLKDRKIAAERKMAEWAIQAEVDPAKMGLENLSAAERDRWSEIAKGLKNLKKRQQTAKLVAAESPGAPAALEKLIPPGAFRKGGAEAGRIISDLAPEVALEQARMRGELGETETERLLQALPPGSARREARLGLLQRSMTGEQIYERYDPETGEWVRASGTAGIKAAQNAQIAKWQSPLFEAGFARNLMENLIKRVEADPTKATAGLNASIKAAVQTGVSIFFDLDRVYGMNMSGWLRDKREQMMADIRSGRNMTSEAKNLLDDLAFDPDVSAMDLDTLTIAYSVATAKRGLRRLNVEDIKSHRRIYSMKGVRSVNDVMAMFRRGVREMRAREKFYETQIINAGGVPVPYEGEELAPWVPIGAQGTGNAKSAPEPRLPALPSTRPARPGLRLDVSGDEVLEIPPERGP